MPDIHLREGNFNKSNGSGTIKIVFHTPNDKIEHPNNYPGGVISVLQGLDQLEIDGLLDGSLYEHVVVLNVNIKDGLMPIKSQIQWMWHDVRMEIQDMLCKKYKFFGLTFERSTN